VGDQITIQIVEKVTASQVSKSTANRTTSGSASVSAFPLLSPLDLANLKAGVGTSSASDFSGKGGTESANTFFGTITATVVDVLPNGHLMVAGDKQIGVNQNVDVMRFSGTIDPRLIQPGNLINSTQIANARMESKGRGAQAERIKEVAAVQGVRSNQLSGYGLVVGLDGTGDQTTQMPYTTQAMSNYLQQMGITLPPGTALAVAAQERGHRGRHGPVARLCAAGAD
jgi:flagellar L-ring protein precursor FlgH